MNAFLISLAKPKQLSPSPLGGRTARHELVGWSQAPDLQHPRCSTLTLSARQVGVSSAITNDAPITPTLNAIRLSPAFSAGRIAVSAGLSRWHSALPPPGGGGSRPQPFTVRESFS